MSHDRAMDDTEALHPASGSLPEGGPRPRARSRLRLPCTAKTVRVRSLALWVSLSIHAALFAMLCASRLDVPPQEAPPLINIEFVEIPGPKGGGGNPGPTLPAPKGQAAHAQAPQAVPLPEPTSRQTAQPAINAAPASGTTEASGQTIGAGGSGGGSGGGQGAGVGTSVGSGTGQGGIAVDRMPVVVRRIKPVYPMDARRRGISGQVTLRLYVDAEGGVREVQVQAAEPAGVFEEKAVEAARKWHFSPAMSRGAAVGMWMNLPVRFSLEDR